MIQSMTAFARGEITRPWGVVTWELRTVNHRYLEPSFKLPDSCRALEPALREALRQRLERGKVDIGLRVQLQQDTHPEALDHDRLRAVIRAAEAVAELAGNPAPLNPLELLRWPGVLQESAVAQETLNTTALEAFGLALEQLVETRIREGAALKQLLEERLAAMEAQLAVVREALPRILAAQRQRLEQRLAELTAELDPGRLEQEVVILAQKADVDEELDRLVTHIREVRRVLSKGGACGRRLDFLMQELNREANTLASKSIATDTTQVAVELKVLIEQMREQVQNIE